MRIESAGRRIELFGGESEEAPLVVLNTVRGEGGKVYDETRAATDADFSLACVGDLDWNRDLSPWRAPSIRGGDEPFAGGADGYLALLAGSIVPEAEEALGNRPSFRVLAGYSLAGLFAVYSTYRTDMFSRIASASGSFWFPGFMDFARSHEPVRVPDRLYLSVGDREARTRSPVLSTVEDNTRELCGEFLEMGAESLFETNPGNHFNDPTGRMAKGIAWTLRRRPSFLAGSDRTGHGARRPPWSAIPRRGIRNQ